MSVDTATAPESAAQTTARRWSKRTMLVMVVVLGLTAAGGYYAPQAYDWVTLGDPASSIAKTLGCTGYTRETQHKKGPTKYKDAGSCVLHGARLNIVTFASGRDGSVFDQLLALRVQDNLAQGRTASFASGRGWNVSDTSFTRAVAQDVVKRMGSGVVNRVVAGANARAAPSPPAPSPPAASPSRTKPH